MRKAWRLTQYVARSQYPRASAPTRSFATQPRCLPPRPLFIQPLRQSERRYNSSSTSPGTPIAAQSNELAKSQDDLGDPQKTQGKPREPLYKLTFTCKPCGFRSSHHVTKHGYHKGTVLITCPECKNRHIISDHLQIFMDQKSTLEDILARKHGQLEGLVKKGKLGIRQGEMVGNAGEEDVEFWEDDKPFSVNDEKPESYYDTWRRRLWEEEKEYEKHGNLQGLLKRRADNVGTPQKGDNPPEDWTGNTGMKLRR